MKNKKSDLKKIISELQDALMFYADPENYELSFVNHSRSQSLEDPLVEQENRHTNPPGEFDKFKRFYADEHTDATMNCRRPSAKWPYSQMTAARTAAHCAEVYDVEDDMLIFVKRVALACDRKYDVFTAREFLGKPFRKVLLAEARRMNEQARQLEDA